MHARLPRPWLILLFAVRRVGPILGALAALLVASTIAPGIAGAEEARGHTVSVAVLSFDSEDAEEQADAFTGALRSRVRSAQGWSLSEISQSLAMLTAALKCPAHPPPECQARIGEQLKTGRYIWGFVKRGPQMGQVTAEVHLFQTGRPETTVRESYADNLKDQNDDTLLKIAQRVLDRLAKDVLGVVVISGPAGMNGDVVVDGEKKVALTGGHARISLGPGNHSIEVVPMAGPPTRRNVLVAVGKESTFAVEGERPSETAAAEPDAPFPTKRVLGGVALGAGILLGALATQQFLFYDELQERGNEEAKLVPAGKAPCDPGTDQDFCNIDKRARTASAIAWTAAGVGVVAIGAGLYLLFIADPDAPEKPPSTAKARVVPSVGPGGGGLMLTGAF